MKHIKQFESYLNLGSVPEDDLYELIHILHNIESLIKVSPDKAIKKIQELRGDIEIFTAASKFNL